MSLSQEPVLSLLKEHFVVGWRNIKREKYVGSSKGYSCKDEAVGTTNGAGPGNMQMFILAPDSTVLHCLPGFWHPEDLAHELRMTRELYRLSKSKRSKKEKREMFKRIQLTAMSMQPYEMQSRSGWQQFDALNERQRLGRLKPGQQRDTFYYKNGKPGKIKPTSVVLHERMAKRPFVKFAKFDIKAFVDYGRKYYDNNGGGISFAGGASEGALESAKRMADLRKARAAKKAKAEARYGKKSKAADKYAKAGKKPAKPMTGSKKGWGEQQPTSRPSKKKKGKKGWAQKPTSRPTSRPSSQRPRSNN